MNYKVTIGIPVYNAERYIRVAMDSALAQTFDDIEFLILDDCGTDASMDIVRTYQQTHHRGKDIHIVRQPRNMGIGAGRNRLIDEAQGKYIYYMDADDEIAPQTIELLYGEAVKYGAQLVYGSYERIEDFGGEVKRVAMQYPAMHFSGEDEYATYVYGRYERVQAMIWNVLIDLDVYRKNGIRHKQVNYWEDFTFTIDLPTYVREVVLLPDVTYFYYCRNGSLSNFQKRQRIAKQEVMTTIQAVEENKDVSSRLRRKSYFPMRMMKVMMTDFYIVCTILHDKGIIQPAFTMQEIHDVMRSPLTLKEIMSFKKWRWPNLLLFMLWKLPPRWSVLLVRIMAKPKRLI